MAAAFGGDGAIARAGPPASAGWLGRSEAELREEFGDALLAERIEQRGRSFVTMTPPKPEKPEAGAKVVVRDADLKTTADVKDPFSEQQRLVRFTHGADVSRVEYELFRSRVYRVRWQLAERFERPLMDSLVAHLIKELGKPYYDQLIEAQFASGRATLRRAGWRKGSRTFELRQLNPMVGGPTFVTLSDQELIRSIVASTGTAAPEPDSIGRWWQKPIKPPEPLTRGDRDTLTAAFDTVLQRVGWER